MGRSTTGAVTTREVLRIELSYLLSRGMIIKGRTILSNLSWTNDSTIAIISSYTDSEKYLRLIYQTTNYGTDEVTKHDYKIGLNTKPSNLGRGEVLYFICPVSGHRARILYKCYGSPIWKSRFGYSYRIYYDSQTCSKREYHNNRYFSINKRLEKLREKQVKSHYQGLPTRLAQKIQLLELKENYHDDIRTEIFLGVLNRMVMK